MSFTHISHYMFITAWLFISPFIFKFFIGVYKQYTQLMSIAIAWNFTGLWHTVTCCPDIRHFTKYTSGIYCILWKFQHIAGLISYGWYSEVYSSHCISLLYSCTLMSTHFHCIYSLYTVYTLCWHSHMGFTYTKRIHLVYLWYKSVHKKVHTVVYTTCIHPVSFF